MDQQIGTLACRALRPALGESGEGRRGVVGTPGPHLRLPQQRGRYVRLLVRRLLLDELPQRPRGVLGPVRQQLALPQQQRRIRGELEVAERCHLLQLLARLGVIPQPRQADGQGVVRRRRLLVIRVRLEELAVLVSGQLVHAAVEQAGGGAIDTVGVVLGMGACGTYHLREEGDAQQRETAAGG